MKKESGAYSIIFDSINLSSGVYFYRIAIHSDRLTTNGFIKTKNDCYKIRKIFNIIKTNIKELHNEKNILYQLCLTFLLFNITNAQWIPDGNIV